MTAYLEKALNLKRIEFVPASMLFAYLFLMMGAYIMGSSVGTALFLSAYPDKLPHVIIGTALVVAAFTSMYIRMSSRTRLELLIIGSLVFFGISFAVFWWMTLLPGKFVYALIYIWVAMAGAMGPTMGWTVANLILTTREARRVFGFIGAGAVLGAPTAGFFTAFATRHIHPESLLLLLATLLGACALLIRLLFRKSKARLAELSRTPTPAGDIPKNFREIWAHIRGSRFLLLITGLTAIGCASTTIITYQFSMVAKAAFTQKAQLASFFALFFGFMGVAAFLVQVLVTGRLLRILGIRLTLFVTPVVFLGGSGAMLFAPMLLTACILKGSHLLLRFTLDKSTTELLYLPVTPPDIKSQLKPFIDGFVWRAADGVAGLALLFFATRLHFSPSRISWVNFVFLSGWIAAAYGVRHEYLNVLRRAIERRTLDADRIATGVLDSTTAEVLAMSFERGGEQQVLYGLSLFEVSREPGSHPALRRLLEHPSPTVRQRALRLLSDAGDRNIIPQVEKLLEDEAPEVRTEALHYLVVHTGRDPLSLLSAETTLPDYCVQASVAAYLARTEQPENITAAQMVLESMLTRTEEDAPRARAEAARVLGVIPVSSGMHGELPRLLRDKESGVAEQALLSAGKIQSRECLPQVIESLGQPPLLGAARAALVQYGERAVGTLGDYLNDETGKLAARKQVPGVLARIASRESAALLVNSIVQRDPGLRFDVLKALNRLRVQNPSLLPASVDIADMLEAELMGYYRSFQIWAALDEQAGSRKRSASAESLLTRVLRERMDQELERIFRLLALLYPPRDMHNAFLGLTSDLPRDQANALEVLEHLLRPELYHTLASALDPDVSLNEKLQFAARLCFSTVGSKAEALRILLSSEDRWLRACAMYAVGKYRLKELWEEVRRVARAGDPLLEETWNWVSARLQPTATA